MMSASVATLPISPTSYSSSVSVKIASEEQLLDRYQSGDVAAREELVRRFLPLAKRLASRHSRSGESQEDLEQVAVLGLLKAVDRYDPALGPFVGYAVPNIIGELKRHFRDRGWTMRVPRSTQEHYLAVRRATDQLSGELGRSPTPKDIAEHTALALEEVMEALDAATCAYSPIPLDAPHPGEGEDQRTLGDTLGAEDPGYDSVDLGDVLTPAFLALPPREQTILRLRFVEDFTQREIGEQIGMSQMHVSRLLRRALDRLRVAAAA